MKQITIVILFLLLNFHDFKNNKKPEKKLKQIAHQIQKTNKMISEKNNHQLSKTNKKKGSKVEKNSKTSERKLLLRKRKRERERKRKEEERKKQEELAKLKPVFKVRKPDPLPEIDDHKYDNVEIPEEDLKDAVHNPIDVFLSHYSGFGKDKRITDWIYSLFRKNKLNDLYDFNLVDSNYFIGSHKHVGNMKIKERKAMTEMNFDQYFKHKEILLHQKNKVQSLMTNFGEEKETYNRMMNLRRQRQIIFDSVIAMENIIYMEQSTLSRKIDKRRTSGEAKVMNQIKKEMKKLEGKIYYPRLYDRRDIFRD